MVQRIDYYAEWNRRRVERTELLDREKKSLALIVRCLGEAGGVATLVDLGCGHGFFLRQLRGRVSARLLGFDASPAEVAEARRAGLDVREANLEERLPLDDASVDLVYAAEVLEHLVDPDGLVAEIGRVLRPGGHLVLTTPNLCAWFNRVLVPLGIQPLFVETSSRSSSVGVGPLRRWKKSDLPVGHIRIFTARAVRDLLELYGFETVAVRGAAFDEGLPRAALALDRVLAGVPGLAADLVVAARKV